MQWLTVWVHALFVQINIAVGHSLLLSLNRLMFLLVVLRVRERKWKDCILRLQCMFCSDGFWRRKGKEHHKITMCMWSLKRNLIVCTVELNDHKVSRAKQRVSFWGLISFWRPVECVSTDDLCSVGYPTKYMQSSAYKSKCLVMPRTH